MPEQLVGVRRAECLAVQQLQAWSWASGYRWRRRGGWWCRRTCRTDRAAARDSPQLRSAERELVLHEDGPVRRVPAIVEVLHVRIDVEVDLILAEIVAKLRAHGERVPPANRCVSFSSDPQRSPRAKSLFTTRQRSRVD